jgi:heme-degrading monooxygenase HmoA
MIIEHAILHVRAGESDEFEAALEKAKPLISVSPGFIDLEVRAASEQQDLYLLLVKWTDIASHRDGFRTSDRYELWRDLLHKYYDPMPVIHYFGDPV